MCHRGCHLPVAVQALVQNKLDVLTMENEASLSQAILRVGAGWCA